MDARTLFTIGTYVSGFFDFVVAVVVIVFALTVVRRADATAGYVLGGAMGVRFVAACCTRGVSQMTGVDESLQMASAGLSIVKPFFDLGLWAAVVFCFLQLAKKIPTSSS